MLRPEADLHRTTQWVFPASDPVDGQATPYRTVWVVRMESNCKQLGKKVDHFEGLCYFYGVVCIATF